jgi:hypothetical protein
MSEGRFAVQMVKNVFYTAAIIAAIPLAIVAAPIVATAHNGVHLLAWRRGNAPSSWPSSGERILSEA